MDINPPCGRPIFPVVIGLGGLQSSRTPEPCTCTVISEELVKDLENSFIGLHMQEAKESDCTSGEDNSSVSKDVLCKDLKTHEALSAQKCLSKSATFQSPNEKIYCYVSSEQDFEGALEGNSAEESKHPGCSHACSLPLMSAMKGTREKHGLSLQKQTVTWAPDVYDPIPTIISHTVVKGRKQQRSKNKKNWKNKHKGDNKQKGSNSSRGSNSKDKKQLRKVVGSPGCYKILDAREKLVPSDYAKGLDNFDIGKPDSYCGSGFFKNSLAEFHYSTAEAL